MSAWRQGSWRINAWRQGSWRGMDGSGEIIIYFTGVSKARESGISIATGVSQRKTDAVSYEGQEYA